LATDMLADQSRALYTRILA